MVGKGLFGLFKNSLWSFYGLFVFGFVSWIVIVCGLSKKLFLGAVWMKRKIWTIKGLFGQFYGKLKGLFGQFLCLVKGAVWAVL